jgi:hypothetical protein
MFGSNNGTNYNGGGGNYSGGGANYGNGGTNYNNNAGANNARGEVTREIRQELGTLSTNERGWTRKVCIIAWNGGADKLDIRDWNGDGNRCGKGVSLTDEEAYNLYMILNRMYGGGGQ